MLQKVSASSHQEAMHLLSADKRQVRWDVARLCTTIDTHKPSLLQFTRQKGRGL